MPHMQSKERHKRTCTRVSNSKDSIQNKRNTPECAKAAKLYIQNYKTNNKKRKQKKT